MSADEKLEPVALAPISPTDVSPRGWLRRQLRLQADGLTGPLDEEWADLADNAWLGGDRDGWERGPYYADGLVPLAYLLEDEALLEKATRWVEGFLAAQGEDGWFTPSAFEDGDGERDVWAQAIVLKVLAEYHAATGDDRAVEAARAFLRSLWSYPDGWELHSWGKMRWLDLVLSVQWVSEETGEPWLLELSELIETRGYDWDDHFRSFRYKAKQPSDVHRSDQQMQTHVVNNAMGIKASAISYRESPTPSLRSGVEEAIETLDRYHGQATGVFTGDEHFGGKDPSRGTELCAVVEYMFSLETAASILGEPRLLDRLERIAFNALPAAFTPDMCAHQYDQQANQVLCTIAEREWTNGPDANLYGQEPHFGCCHATCHQGWPKFARHLWFRTPEGGLATGAYGPSEVTATLEGVDVRIEETTAYPFEDAIEFRVDVDDLVDFPLSLRVPAWAADATVTLPDGTTEKPEPGTYATIDREWTSGETVTLELPATVSAERRHGGSVALSRGPLVFSLLVDAERKLVGGTPPRADWEHYPTTIWNVGLEIDAEEPEASIDLEAGSPGEIPFDPSNPPIELTVSGRRVPGWRLEDDRAGPLPASPVRSTEPREELTLVPYGATELRVTEFPLLE